MRPNGVDCAPHRDERSTIRGLYDHSGSAVGNPFLFTGREWDPESRLYQYRFRYLEPRSGRFLTRDPLGAWADPANLGNPYAYVGNSPWDTVDPLGLYGLQDWWSDMGSGARIVGGWVAKPANWLVDWTVDTVRRYNPFQDVGPIRSANPGLYTPENGVALSQTRYQGHYQLAVGQFKEIRCEVQAGAGEAGKNAATDYLVGKTLAMVGGIFGRYGDDVVEETAQLASRQRAGGGAIVPRAASPLGEWGEARLRQAVGGLGFKPSMPFWTSYGLRYVDRLIDGVAHEAKAGVNVRLTSKIKMQILKDVELIQAHRIKGAHWHFFQGADAELLEYLARNGIEYTVY